MNKETPWKDSWTILKSWPRPSDYSLFSGWSCARFSGVTRENETPAAKQKSVRPSCGPSIKRHNAAVMMPIRRSKSCSCGNNAGPSPVMVSPTDDVEAQELGWCTIDLESVRLGFGYKWCISFAQQ